MAIYIDPKLGWHGAISRIGAGDSSRMPAIPVKIPEPLAIPNLFLNDAINHGFRSKQNFELEYPMDGVRIAVNIILRHATLVRIGDVWVPPAPFEQVYRKMAAWYPHLLIVRWRVHVGTKWFPQEHAPTRMMDKVEES